MYLSLVDFCFRLQITVFAIYCLTAPAWALPPPQPQTSSPEPREAWRSFRPRPSCAERRNFNTISRIYNLTVYPNQLPIISAGGAGVPPGLFSHSVSGRVDPVGNFKGFEDSIEYFFSLAPVPQGNPSSAAITSYKIVEFSSGCKEVAASVVYLYCSVVKPGSPEHGKALAPLKQVR